MTRENPLEKASDSLRDIVGKLSGEHEGEPESSEYQSFTIEPGDEMYESHVSYLNEENGMDINYGDPVTHITGECDTTIYAGPTAEKIVERQEYLRDET